MGLANCKRCNGLFVKVNRDICDRCYREEEETLLEVQRYIKANPHASVQDVCEEYDLDENLVAKWIREKRLLLKYSSLSVQVTNCESCRAPILAGRLCASCREKLADDFKIPESADSTGKSGSTSASRRNQILKDTTILDKFKR